LCGSSFLISVDPMAWASRIWERLKYSSRDWS
jgi:hypothetical protein